MPDPIPILEPLHTIHPSTAGAEINSCAFSPDGSSLYVLEHVNALDLWALLVSYWPEVLGGVLAIITLIVALRVQYVLRRRRIHDAPHCRRCNYDLTPQVTRSPGRPRFSFAPDVLCPECGTPLARRAPIRGRRTRRRLFPALTIWLAFALGYGALWIIGLPRYGPVSGWIAWRSEWALSLGIRSKHLPAWVGTLRQDRVVEYQTSSASLLRTVCRSHARGVSYALTLTPDGGGLFLSADANEVVLHDVRSGAVRARAQFPGSTFINPGTPPVIGFSPDGGTAYVQWVNQTDGVSGVSAWNLATNTSTQVAAGRAYADDRSGRRTYYGRSFLLRTSQPPTFVSIPHFMEAFPTKTMNVQLHDGPSGPSREFHFGTVPSTTIAPAVSPDSSTLFWAGNMTGSLIAFDLSDGSSLGEASRSWQEAPNFQGVLISEDGRFVVTGASNEIDLRDVKARQWAARLTHLPTYYGADPVLAPNSRWLAAKMQYSPTPNTFGFDILLWDLSSLK